MASVGSSDGATQPLRATEYSAIPITNAQPPSGMQDVKDDGQSFLRRMVPVRTAVAGALLLAFCCGLIGRESAKWSYSRNFSRLRAASMYKTSGFHNVPNTVTKIGPTILGQIAREAVYLTEPSDSRDIHNRDGTHTVVSIYSISPSQIQEGETITVSGKCPVDEHITSCMCTTTARSCLVAGIANVGPGNGCRCAYTGITSDCSYSTARLFAIAYCATV